MSSDDSESAVLRWMQRPFYPYRKVAIGPKLTNFGALVLFVALVLLVVLWEMGDAA